MIKKIKLILSCVLILLICNLVNAQNLDYDIKDILEEGATKTYTVKGVAYEITASIITASQAQFVVNGELTTALEVNQQYTLADGSIIYVVEIPTYEQREVPGDLVEFQFKGGEKPIEKEIPTEEEEEVQPEEEEIPTEEIPTIETCNGCLKVSTCLPFGTRIVEENVDKFCDITKNFVSQKEKGETCQNNYECKTNQCSNGICIDLTEELKETVGLLQKILDWIKSIFGIK